VGGRDPAAREATYLLMNVIRKVFGELSAGWTKNGGTDMHLLKQVGMARYKYLHFYSLLACKFARTEICFSAQNHKVEKLSKRAIKQALEHFLSLKT
jgi:hypothetical protein